MLKRVGSKREKENETCGTPLRIGWSMERLGSVHSYIISDVLDPYALLAARTPHCISLVGRNVFPEFLSDEGNIPTEYFG
ncbi:hypothetical protein TNCV_3828661 [Trichonephila clavipes]|nr:hypothetical protein TNCV_3828661 [Trichonephila clavipes]